MRASRKADWLPFILIVLALAALVGLTVFNYRFAVQNPGGNDFLVHWFGTRKWLQEDVSPYDESVSLALQQMIYGHPADPAKGEDKNYVVYPLYSVLFIAPFSLLEYTLARALWMTVLEVCLVGLVLVSLRLTRWRTPLWMTALLVVFSLTWYHGMRTLILGQFAGVNALMIALGLYFIALRQDVPAGVFLALATIKPNMVALLIPFLLLWALSRGRFRFIFATLGTLSLLVVGAMALMPDWPLQWVLRVIEYPRYTAYIGIDSPLSYLAGLTPAIQQTLNGALHVALGLYLLAEWVQAWGKDERRMLWVAALTMVVTNLVAYRTATPNYLMLMPVLFLIFSVWEQRWKFLGRLMVLLSLLLLLVGLWVLFAATVQGNQEAPVMYLPVPYLCLVGLWWVRWWAIQPPRLMLEEIAARFG